MVVSESVLGIVVVDAGFRGIEIALVAGVKGGGSR